MKGFVILLLLFSLFQCDWEGNGIDCENTVCATKATVVDLTGLDGCRFLFELADGTRLEPERRTYIKAPTPVEDPLYHFELNAGQVVKINWEESTDLASICMAGPIVFITCITECKKPIN
ncbi:MAG TPA: hypothetical protein VIS49_04740 [Cyclobacteriaceae bacterium]